MDSTNSGDCVIVLGDMNAQIGQEHIYKDVEGTHSMHIISNENDKLEIQMTSTNSLKIMSAFFHHKIIHKERWQIPGTNNCNQINHILI